MTMLTLAIALTVAAQPSEPNGSTASMLAPGLLWHDVDADGDLDVLALDARGTLKLLIHQRDGVFADETVQAGLGGIGGVELALVREPVDGAGPGLVLAGPSGLRSYEWGGDAFVDSTVRAGLDAVGPVAGLAWVDPDQDGALDLHVTTRGGSHRILTSAGDGTFLAGSAFTATEAWYSVPAPEDAVGSVDEEEPAADSTSRTERAGPRLEGRLAASAKPSRRGARDATSAASATGLGPTMTASLCSSGLDDQASSGCLLATSVPTFGALRPLDGDLYVDAATGYVGVQTTSPTHPLTVEGPILSGFYCSVSDTAAVGGGVYNSATGSAASIGGGRRNRTLAHYAAVGGGGSLFDGEGNEARAEGSVIGGGFDNEIRTTGGPLANHSGIAGGDSNRIGEGATEDCVASSIGGGFLNSILDMSTSRISGGGRNTIDDISSVSIKRASTVGGGFYNSVEGSRSTVAGGSHNDARGSLGAIGGGNQNSVDGSKCVVAGGQSNLVDDHGSTVPGGDSNRVFLARYSFAAGRRARIINDDGAFVWADSTNADFDSTADDQFLIRASGGVGIGTGAPAAKVHVVGDDGLRATATASSGIGINANGGSSGIGIRADGGEYAGRFLDPVVVAAGSDVTPTGGAFLQCGASTGRNVAFDTNEIMARNNGAVADLSLNIDGGNVEMLATGPGRVGIGTNDPAAKLDVFGESSADVFRVRVDSTTRLVLDGNGGLAVGANFTPSYDLEISSSAPNGGTAAKPGGGSWSNSSDRRLKRDIEDLEGALETLLALRGVTYEYIDPDAINELHGTRVGFVAQEVAEVFPDWVGEKPDGMKMLTIRGFEALAAEALQELETENRRLRDEIAAFEARLDALDAGSR